MYMSRSSCLWDICPVFLKAQGLLIQLICIFYYMPKYCWNMCDCAEKFLGEYIGSTCHTAR